MYKHSVPLFLILSHMVHSLTLYKPFTSATLVLLTFLFFLNKVSFLYKSVRIAVLLLHFTLLHFTSLHFTSRFNVLFSFQVFLNTCVFHCLLHNQLHNKCHLESG